MLASRLIYFPSQWSHLALWTTLQPDGGLLRWYLIRQLTPTEVLPPSPPLRAGLMSDSTNHLFQSGIPSTAIQAKWQWQMCRSLTDHWRVSWWLTQQLLQGCVPMVCNQTGGLVCQLANQRSERVLPLWCILDWTEWILTLLYENKNIQKLNYRIWVNLMRAVNIIISSYVCRFN